MAKKKVKKVRIATELVPCQPGYTRAANGECVKDPLPPDPSHPPQ